MTSLSDSQIERLVLGSEDEDQGTSQPSHYLGLVRAEPEREEETTMDGNSNVIQNTDSETADDDPTIIGISGLPSIKSSEEIIKKRKSAEENDEHIRKKRNTIGRNLDKTWSEFTVTGGPSKLKCKCKHCKEDVSAKVERLRTHLKKCKAFKTQEGSSGATVSRISNPAPVTQQPNQDIICLTTPPRKKKQKAKSFIDVVDQETKTKLDHAVGRYIFATNLPFRHVEHGQFVALLNDFRPGYVPPKQKAIGGSILQSVHETVVEKMKQQLLHKSVTLIQDGWKTASSKEPVIAHSVTTGEKAFFINAITPKDNRKTSDYCRSLLMKTIEHIERQYKAKVIAVVTDNCNTMKRMRDDLPSQRPDLLTFGCQCHLLNLVGKRLTPSDLMQKIETVHKYFRNHDIPLALLKERKGTMPVLATDVRWNSWIECFESFIKNQTNFIEVSRMQTARMQKERNILEIINDPEIYGQLKLTVENLKPIQIGLDKLQKENAKLADGVPIWMDLKRKLIFQDDSDEDYFIEQYNLAVQEVAIAAYMLHPVYRGENLDMDLVQKGHLFLAEQDPILLQSVEFFPSSMFSKTILEKLSPVTWWKTQGPIGKIDNDTIDDTIEFAIKILSLPPGSADIERHFSTMGSIMTTQRPWLGIKKAEKLCQIYKMYGKDYNGNSDCLSFEDVL